MKATRNGTPAPPQAVPAVRVIPPDAVLFLDELRQVLGLPKTALKRQVRLGHLRVARRCGRYITTGRWVNEWITQGEHRPGGCS
jgi:hypothetical protein